MTSLPILFEKPHWLSKYRIIRLNHRAIEAYAGAEGGGLDDLEEKIVIELLERRNLAGNRGRTPDGLAPMLWLRATLYGVILLWLAHEDGEELFNRISEAGRYSKGDRSEDATVFHDGIVAVLARHTQVITPTERDRMARPMWHAFRHYIQPAFLLGFNHQYPSHLNRNAAPLGLIDERLVGWVVEQRVQSRVRDCSLDGHRGAYPDEIEHEVDRIVTEALFELNRARKLKVGEAVGETDPEWPD